MVTLNQIYTRGGDGGKTSLGDGSRVLKFSPRVEAYGTVDEANATLGLARLHLEGEVDAQLGRVQNDLFDLGADLCRPGEDGEVDDGRLRVTPGQVERLEREIDGLNEALQPLSSFVLPGGTPAAAYLHLARTITRRAERLVVELADQETVSPVAIHYLNRLSDYLFVAARFVNDRGALDVLWVPGAHR
ncbi:MAG: cob(I)yrinic acid a,c-diamide adenosyltransferase [Pseudomonadota bacterium]